MSARVRGATRRLSALVALSLAAAACKLDEATVPASKPQIVVHAVLNPVVLDQVVLVEQTLTGEVNIPDRSPSDSLEPILSGGGIPISDALVRMRAPRPDTLGWVVGIQDAADRADGKGHGVYRFKNTAQPIFAPPHGEIPIVRGATYELEIRWRGTVARAHTTVPNPDRLLPRQLDPRTFNRDHDSVVFDWPKATAAARYGVLASTPFGPFLMFSDSARLVIHGDVRNIFVEALPYVFQPGFKQTVSTSAVDTNYFDYYRSINNPFTGSGIINHVDGGVGVFGAIYPLDTLALDVTADFDEPYEGRYLGGFAGGDVIELYLGEDVGDGTRRVSGRLTQGNQRHGIVGTTRGGGQLSLIVLRGWFANDGLYPLRATAAGDSLVTVDPGGDKNVWRRSAPTIATKSR